MLLLAAWKTAEGLRIIPLIQGGYREIMGTFFFGCGFLFRQWERQYKVTWWMTVVFAVIVALFSQYLTANMNWRSSFTQFISLPVPAICGFLMTYNIATYLNRHEGMVKRFLVYCGDNTLPIFVFHIISYKVVSLLKIWYYDLDMAQIGCHMVIHEHAKEDWFWVLYAIVGVGIPLGWTWCYQRIKSRQQHTSA
jgi:fucose 4-O-acetylase-like acetyltransferase